jgi:hypothetical protein
LILTHEQIGRTPKDRHDEQHDICLPFWVHNYSLPSDDRIAQIERIIRQKFKKIGSGTYCLLQSIRVLLIVPDKHPLAQFNEVRFDQIKEEMFIMPKKSCDNDVRRILKENNVTPRPQ